MKKSSRWRAKLIEYESEEKALNKVIAASYIRDPQVSL